MEKTRTPTQAAYDRVLEHVKASFEKQHGTRYGAMLWLAGQIGVSRHVLDMWRVRDGFPAKYVELVVEATGLKRKDIRPDILAIKIPREAWSVICKHAPKDAVDQAVVGRK